jgi:hypothetical protein
VTFNSSIANALRELGVFITSVMMILIRHNAGIIYNCGDELNGLWNGGITKAGRTT